jgi:hypothetical protein
MRFVIDPEFHKEMLERTDHTADCYVRPGQYLHHLYVDGVKYVVVQAMLDCLKDAEQKNDAEAIHHLRLHKEQYDAVEKQAQLNGTLDGAQVLGDPPPEWEDKLSQPNAYFPPPPKNLLESGLAAPYVMELILRTIYNRGRLTGAELAGELRLPFSVVQEVLPPMRKQALIDVVGQKATAVGDAALEYEIKPPKGTNAVQDAINKCEYVGPAPVPFNSYVQTVKAQTIKSLVVTRRTIEKAFYDLIITPAVFNEIGPAINSAASIFLFGYPGNGKTSIAERITRLMGDDIYVPYAVEVNNQLIKVYDPIVHTVVESEVDSEKAGTLYALLKGPSWDRRYVKVKRPTIITGGELTLSMLDLRYNTTGKFYEAPFQMKANGGIFMIDDFGRQQVRAVDLLNRWIVPLEKRFDYLTTITGTKIEVPFDELLIFSTNLDPNQLADEAFLRRIKYKIEVRDPSEGQWRQIWKLVCKGRKVEYDDKGVDYLVEKWYQPFKRPLRMCHPRDIVDQMINIAKYNMQRVSFDPDLIDASCATYFVTQEKREFGAKVRIE